MGRPKGTVKKAVTVRLPELLIARMNTAIGAGSQTEWIEETIRMRLDGPPTVIYKPRSVGMTAMIDTLLPGQAEHLHSTDAPFGRSIADVLAASGSRRDPEPEVESQPKRDWQKFLAELDEMDPEEARATQAETFSGLKVPRGLLSRTNRPKLLRWLQVNA